MYHEKFHLLDGLKTKFRLAAGRRTSVFTVRRVQTDQIKIVGFFYLGFDKVIAFFQSGSLDLHLLKLQSCSKLMLQCIGAKSLT